MLFTSIPHISNLHGNKTVFILSCFIVVLLELLIFICVYYIVVTRVPRQFAQCLKKGYPELTILYGYDSITNGNLTDTVAAAPLSFSLLIEEIFELQSCNDIVVTGFAHGLIQKNNSVYITKKISDNNKPETAALVTEIQTINKNSVMEAADCHIALRIQNGKDILLKQGMYLYREDSLSDL